MALERLGVNQEGAGLARFRFEEKFQIVEAKFPRQNVRQQPAQQVQVSTGGCPVRIRRSRASRRDSAGRCDRRSGWRFRRATGRRARVECFAHGLQDAPGIFAVRAASPHSGVLRAARSTGTRRAGSATGLWFKRRDVFTIACVPCVIRFHSFQSAVKYQAGRLGVSFPRRTCSREPGRIAQTASCSQRRAAAGRPGGSGFPLADNGSGQAGKRMVFKVGSVFMMSFDRFQFRRVWPAGAFAADDGADPGGQRRFQFPIGSFGKKFQLAQFRHAFELGKNIVRRVSFLSPGPRPAGPRWPAGNTPASPATG